MMNGIITVMVSAMAMFLVCRLLKRSIYITGIVKVLAFVLTVISTLSVVNSSFYGIFNLCERISVRDAVFVFIIGGAMTVTMLFLVYCYVGQVAAKRKITF